MLYRLTSSGCAKFSFVLVVHRVHRVATTTPQNNCSGRVEICPLSWSVHHSPQFLYVMVDLDSSERGWAWTPHPDFFHHNGIYARKWPLPLCVHSVTSSALAPMWTFPINESAELTLWTLYIIHVYSFMSQKGIKERERGSIRSNPLPLPFTCVKFFVKNRQRRQKND